MVSHNNGPTRSGFRPVPRTGVIYVMTEAAQCGYRPESDEWINLGQGAPETGALPGSPAPDDRFEVQPEDHEYAPIGGLPELRQAVADLYNKRYRQGRSSLYTADNVAIVSGGRLAMTRVVSTLGKTHVGHFIPDYTAYEELLDAFGTLSPIPVLLDPDRRYDFSPSELYNEILGRGLGAILLSNPCNPTGNMVYGRRLETWVRLCRDLSCVLILDEFYAHYVYVGDHPTVSAARYVEDVDRDPLLILDGLTKNWRRPGWRVAWVLGPRDVIAGLISAGSFLDGGCPRPMQRAALPLLDPARADAEAAAIQRSFRIKRRRLTEGLEDLGFVVDPPPKGGFYCWADLRRLPERVNTGMRLFRAGLEVGLITVPGEFFDINPGQRRPNRPSRFRQWSRISFGPSLDKIEAGLDRLAELVHRA